VTATFLLAIAAAEAFLVWKRLLAYLRYFQQEGYEHLRFLRWVNVRSLTDPGVWLCVACRFLAWGLVTTPQDSYYAVGPGGIVTFIAVSPRERAAAIVLVLGAIVLAVAQPDPRRSGKIPLKMTWRASRVLWTAFIIALGIEIVAPMPNAVVFQPFLAIAVLLVALPLVLIVANALLLPYERGVQQSYELDARHRVREVNPFIIGITGSYGKSSAKAMLAHLLQFKGPTLAASGSINTLMGVTRHIRENLIDGHQYMVVEMGAFKTGSIARLCQLTPPSAGLITAVGDMHLERFGSLDEIVRAKSELAQAVPPGGLLVVNADSSGALRIAKGSTDRRVLLYGESSTEALTTRLEQVSFAKKGTTFVLRTRDRTWECFTPLLGRPIILNLTGAFTLATAAGVDPELAVAAMRTLKPVSNRLEVVEERGITWIRDAYNSNQFGFRAALEVIGALPVARRFLATPGVIEMGPQQFDVNRALSKEAAAVCDQTIVVAETNRAAFVAGHRDAGREDRLVTVAGRSDAFKWLGDHLKEGDAIILENDLPDLYERATGLFWSAG